MESAEEQDSADEKNLLKYSFRVLVSADIVFRGIEDRFKLF